MRFWGHMNFGEAVFNQYTCILTKGRQGRCHTQRRQYEGTTERDVKMLALKIAVDTWRHQKLEEVRKDLLLETLESVGPADSLISAQ